MPLYATAQKTPSIAYFLLHPGCVRPSNDGRLQTKQIIEKSKEIKEKQLAQT